jgi:outer membrane lipoprotein-sorting protein
VRVSGVLIFLFFILTECAADEMHHEEIIGKIKARYDEIQDYQCRLVEYCTDGSRYEKRTINYYFKKPKLIRMDILKGNRPFDTGSVAVYHGSGKVTGHRGGILKHLILNLSKTHTLATTIRGVTIDESDMETVLKRLHFFLEGGIIVVNERVDVYEFVCVPLNAGENDGVTKDIVWIDKKELLIRRNERYEEETLVQDAQWNNYIINAGLPDELFDVHFDVTTLSQRGIPLLGQTIE